MDNAAFHKRADIQELLEQQGHKILWLPAYSPDLNPIEQMWAWVKRKRKEWLIDSVDELFRVFSNLGDCSKFCVSMVFIYPSEDNTKGTSHG